MKRKICYVTTIALTVRAFLIPQLRFLAQNGYDVTVICSPDDILESEIGDTVKFLPVKIERGISPFTLKKSILELKKIFEDNEFDIVQYLTPNAAFVASIAARLAGVKIRNYHLMGFRYLGAKGILRYILRLIEKITCKNSTHIECVSKSNLELGIKEKIFKPQKACVVWNGSTGGVDLKRFDIEKREEWRKEIRQSLGYADDDFVFGFVGRVTKDKGIDELFSAFLPISDRAKLLIVGSAEGVETLDKELYQRSRENDSIMFHDAVSDVERYYAAIDVLVLPSYREGFGMVIIEAAAVGTPAIVSNIPGPINAILENQTAVTVEVKDAQDLRNKMEEFLDNPVLCEQMGNSCVNFVSETFDNGILCEKILERKESLLV